MFMFDVNTRSVSIGEHQFNLGVGIRFRLTRDFDELV